MRLASLKGSELWARILKVVFNCVVVVLKDSELGAHTRGPQDQVWSISGGNRARWNPTLKGPDDVGFTAEGVGSFGRLAPKFPTSLRPKGAWAS